MKKLFLILFLGIIVASCGRNQTEIPTEIVSGPLLPNRVAEEVAQTETTETSQLMDINEITYFDDVFNCTDCRGYLFLAKDMTWYDLSGGSSLFLSYGTYSISNGVVTLSTEYSDSRQYGNRVYNITYKDSELFLIDEDMEYKIDYKANKEELFGNAINLRQKNENTNSREEKYNSSYNSRGDNYSWIDGKWNATNTFSGQDMYGFYHGAIYIELHINYNNRTIKVYMAENDGSPMTVARGIQYSLIYNGSFSIDTYNNELNCGRGGNYKLDAESRRIYNNGSDGRINFYRGSKM